MTDESAIVNIMIPQTSSAYRLTTALTFLMGVAAIAARAETNAEALNSITVPAGFTVTQAAGSDLTAYPMFMAFDDRGRLYIAESSGKDRSGKEMAEVPECLILRLEDANGDGVFDRRTVFADALSLPMGVLWYRDALYVASPPDLIRFEDQDDDGVSDTRDVLLSGWNVLNTASLHGPFIGPDGWLYLTHGRHGYDITTKEGERLEGLAARIWRCRPDGTGLERYCGGGFDNPVELIFNDAGSMIGTMTYFTNPRLGQRDALMHFVYGGVYPKPHESVSEFVRTGDLMPTMTKFARIAPAGLLQYRGDGFGNEYRDALFSAQFNPHRVMSHRLIREGATYRTEDADFLTSTYPDFFPTDVLQDADGSLLVSDTGAWYVDACPISRVAKPEIKGGIYRVRRSDYSAPGDPWGTQIDWARLSNSDTVALLEDPRVFVRDRAFRRMIENGESTEALGALVDHAAAVESRVLALRAIAQIGGPNATATLIKAMDNDAEAVRLSAIRALGDTGVARAIPALRDKLKSDAPQERSEAASTLGRLNAKDASVDLLAASEHAHDRFEEHAIIYALIELGDTVVLANGLERGTLRQQKAALIALDQLNYAELLPEHALVLMESGDEALRGAGLWVASRHTDWADAITGFVGARLKTASLDDAERSSLRAIANAYANNEAMQLAIGGLAMDASLADDRKLFLFDLMDASVASLPDAWRDAIGAGLKNPSNTIRSRAIDAVSLHGLDTFDAELQAIAQAPDESEAIRIAALDALVARRPVLQPDELALISEALAQRADPGIRPRAARVLSHAQLTLDEEVAVAGELIPNADALVMTGILARFEGRTEPALGRALVAALSSNSTIDRLLTGDQADRLFNAYSADVRGEAESLHQKLAGRDERQVARFVELEEHIGGGDVGRGRRIFFGDKASCSTCHAIGDEGGNLGPDLTTIGLVRSGHDLLEAVLFPSASMVPDFTPFLIETADDVHAGIIERDAPGSVSLRMGADERRVIDRDDILSIEPSPVSIMPEGLDAEMSDEELIDLIAFLQSLNNEQWLLPEQRNAGD